MFARYSRKEVALLISIGVFAVVPTALLVWGAAALGSPLVFFLLLKAPLIVLAYLSLFGLIRRRSLGAWGGLVVFALQSVKVEREGALVWPPGYSLGFNIVLVQEPALVVEVVVSSIVFALLAVAVLLQYRDERALSEMPEVVPLLPPNKSLERTRGR